MQIGQTSLTSFFLTEKMRDTCVWGLSHPCLDALNFLHARSYEWPWAQGKEACPFEAYCPLRETESVISEGLSGVEDSGSAPHNTLRTTEQTERKRETGLGLRVEAIFA